MVHTYNVKDGDKKLSNNFRILEFACRCGCSKVLVDSDLVEYLQKIRNHFGKEVILTSAYRCQNHNKKVGGTSGSLHVKGQAADFYINGVAPVEIARYAESIGVKGIGLYEKADCGDDFVHIDTRTKKSFWYGHKQEYRTTFSDSPKKSYNVQLPLLKYGMKHSSVWGLQALLQGYGYDIGESGKDGDFGESTKDAVKKFQLEHDLDVDGDVGIKTWCELIGLE